MIQIKLLSIVGLLAISMPTQAQDGDKDLNFSNGLVVFVGNLKKAITNLFDADKIELMHRKVDYIQQDLTSYLLVRKAIKNILDSSQYNAASSKNIIRPKIEVMRVKLTALVERLEEITPLLNPALRMELRIALEDAQETIEVRKAIWLNELEKFCNGQFATSEAISKFKQNTNTNYNNLRTSLSTFLEIQAELVKKM